MQKIDPKAKKFLLDLGLDNEQVQIYLALLQKGILTTLEISRATQINRTRVYRILEILKTKGLVEEVVDQYRKKAKAVSIDSLDFLVKEQELKAKNLRELFPAISSIFAGNNTVSQPGTKVLFYRGKEGVRQQVWNTLRVKGELLGYSYRPLVELIGNYYFYWYEEWIKGKKKMRDLYSDEYVRSKKEYIQVKKKQLMDTMDKKFDFIESRYIPSSILDINHQVDIYNDVVSYYSWHEGEVFGVEIYNEKVASLQKQLFEIVWKMGK